MELNHYQKCYAQTRYIVSVKTLFAIYKVCDYLTSQRDCTRICLHKLAMFFAVVLLLLL